MSQVRYRVAALALGGLLLGVPLLTNGTASAGQIEDGGNRRVVFGGGGVLSLSCRSTPNIGTLTVPADSSVRVVNRTGYAARLTLGGAAKGTLPDDAGTEVVFRRGTTSVSLSPACPFGTESTPLLVTATPEPIPSPPQVPVQTPENPSTTGPVDSATPPTSSSGSAPTSTSPSTSRPPKTTPVTRRPTAAHPTRTRTAAPATAAGRPAMPPGGAATTEVKTQVVRGTSTGTPTLAEMPPGDQNAVVAGVPTSDPPAMSEAAIDAPAETPAVIAAAEPVAEMRAMPEQQPIGLLAVVAGVFALGVGAAAIRSFASERASRSNMA